MGMTAGAAPLLDIALQYAGRGWRVFPLHSVWFKDAHTPVCTCRRGIECGSNAGKHPRIEGGFKNATTDRAQIEAWWDKWPQANIGIAAGNGLTVLDIDGEKGREELVALMEREGGMPVTLAARTGNGGHLYWDLAGARSAAKGNLHVRGEGGYVVAPPSIHRSGRHYEWVNNAAMVRPPEWLAAWLMAGGESGKGAGGVQRAPSGESTGTALALGPAPSWVANRAPGVSRLADAATINTPWSAHEEARLRSALRSVPPSIDGKTWASIGMALHALEWLRADDSDIGLDIWDAWSRESEGRGEGLGLYKGREDLEKRWASFGKRSGNAVSVTIASIYHEAAQHGWTGEVKVEHANGGINGHAPGANGYSYTFNATFPGAGGSGNSVGGGPIFVDLDKSGRPKPTCVNTRLALNSLGLVCRHDKFHDKLIVGGQVLREWAGELTDNAIHALRGVIHQAYGFDPGTVPAHDAAVQECIAHGFDPVQEYLDSLAWDGKLRLATWMTSYLGAEDTPLHRAMAALSLVAACRRVHVPGAKFDAITVLISNEGHGKSSAIELLAGEENFCDQPILNADERQQQESMQGVWLYEIADLAGMSRADVDKVKAFASRRIDRARPAYARTRVDRPRRCVFFATTNLERFLKSQTGNRRFWPVQVGRVKLDELARDRDQLWAEAVAVERSGLGLGLPERLWTAAGDVQAARMEHDPWDDILGHIQCKEDYDSPSGLGREWRVSSRDLLEINLKIPADRMTDVASKRLSYAMQRCGWSGPRTMRIGAGAPQRGYFKLVSPG